MISKLSFCWCIVWGSVSVRARVSNHFALNHFMQTSINEGKIIWHISSIPFLNFLHIQKSTNKTSNKKAISIHILSERYGDVMMQWIRILMLVSFDKYNIVFAKIVFFRSIASTNEEKRRGMESEPTTKIVLDGDNEMWQLHKSFLYKYERFTLRWHLLASCIHQLELNNRAQEECSRVEVLFSLFSISICSFFSSLSFSMSTFILACLYATILNLPVKKASNTFVLHFIFTFLHSLEIESRKNSSVFQLFVLRIQDNFFQFFPVFSCYPQRFIQDWYILNRFL